LRISARNNDQQEAWRKGTAAEWATIRVALRAERYAEREILHCDSSLVDELVRAATSGELPGDLQGFAYDDIENIYPDPSDWDVAECRTYCDDHGIDNTPDADGREESDVDDWRSAIRQYAEPAEVLEWWRVTSWLCEQLRAIGEVVIDNNYGYWWGRTCSGQGLIMDGTLQQIARKFEEVSA